MQKLTVDMFVSVDGWASGTTSPGYFGYFGPELEKWITTELALPQLVVLGRRTYRPLRVYLSRRVMSPGAGRRS